VKEADDAMDLILAQNAGQDTLLQYGAIGAIALLSLYAVSALFKRQIKSHERDIARANEAEDQLAELNKLIREQFVAQLTRATDVIGRVAEILHDQRYDEERRRDR